MEEQEHKNSKNAIRLPLFVGAAIALGIFIGANMAGGNSATENIFKSMVKFRQVLTHIENDYVDEVDTEELVEKAITEMLKELDPHSVYFTAEELELTRSQLQGNFEGIGVEFNVFKDTIHVVTALSGGPSEGLGIISGDKIISVDGKNVAGVGITNREVISLLRGEKGSTVNVGILKFGSKELIDYPIVRDVIPQYSVDVSYMIDDEIGYIKISRFAATTYMEFKEGLNKLNKSGMKKLVLDLTGNPGGYMDQCVRIIDELVGGKQMIVYTKGKDPIHNSEYFSHTEGDFEKGPVIVLLDGGSASASEIVAGALQDHDRGIIVGRRSFGKGLVQMPIELNDGSAMRLTISRYYTPSGRSIQKPYDGSLEDYHRELYERYENGEIYIQDSVKANDSLIYRTDKGRVVYGGGGIMPDYFVPLDTSSNSKLLTQLFNSNSISEYTVVYAENNKKKLSKMSLDDYIKNFEISDDILDGLLAVGRQNNVKYSASDFIKSKTAIKIYVKAYIARVIWNNDGFFPIINEENEILQKALTLTDEANKLASK